MSDGRLAYDQALAEQYVRCSLARRHFDEALALFRAQGDGLGVLLSLAGVIGTCYLERQDLRAMAEASANLESAYAATDRSGWSDADALVIESRRVLGMMHANYDSPGLPTAVATTRRLLERSSTDPERLAAGNVLLNYANWLDGSLAVDELVSELEPIACRDDVPVSLRVVWACNAAIHQLAHGRNEMANVFAVRARSLAEAHALHHLTFVLDHAHVNALMLRGELAASRECLDRMLQSRRPGRGLDDAILSLLQAVWHGMCGDHAAAVLHAREAVRRSETCRVPPMWGAQFHGVLALAHAGRDDAAQADYWFEFAAREAHAADADVIRECQGLIHVDVALRADAIDESSVVQALRTLVWMHRARGSALLLPQVPSAAARLADEALALDIESDHVRQVVLRQRLIAPDCVTPDWPWPLAIRTFGEVQILRAGDAIPHKARGQRKLLALLGLLVMRGSAGVSCEELEELLWSEEDMSSPGKALEIAIHRLRKWLGDDAAVIWRSGSILIDQRSVWTDLGALDALHFNLSQSGAESLPASSLRRFARSLTRLHRGPFCDGIEIPVLKECRAAQRRRFALCVDRLGELLERSNASDAAEALYRCAVDVLPGAESLYRGLMRVARGRGDEQAVSAAFARCQHELSVAWGIDPSRATEQLAVIGR